MLPMVTAWVVLEAAVTTTALGKSSDAGLTERLGLTDAPLAPGWGSVWPVMSAVRP